MGSCKNPEPFQMVFPHVIVFFPLVVFPSAGFTPWPKDSHERGKGEGKGRVKEGKRKNRKGGGKGKGKEKERKRTRKGKRKEKKRKEIGPNRKGKRKGKKERRRKRKGKEKGEERERKRAVYHTDHFWCQELSFSLSFVNPVYVPFFWKWLQSSKKECSDHLPGTFLVQNLTRIRWRAIMTTNNMKWRNQKH